MANSLNRSLIVCSVIPICILVTLYYWRTKKRNTTGVAEKRQPSVAATADLVPTEVIPSENCREQNHHSDTKARPEQNLPRVEEKEISMQPNEKVGTKPLKEGNLQGEPLVDFTPPGGRDNVSKSEMKLKNADTMSFDIDKAQSDRSRSDSRADDKVGSNPEPGRIEEEVISKKVVALDLNRAPVEVLTEDSTDGGGSTKSPPPVSQDDNDNNDDLNAGGGDDIIIEDIGDDHIPVGDDDSDDIGTSTAAVGAPEMDNECNATTSPSTVEHSSAEATMASPSEKPKDEELVVSSGSVPQPPSPPRTFAQVLSKNCDSPSKNVRPKRQDLGYAENGLAANENEVDIYQNFPDLSAATPSPGPNGQQAMSLAMEFGDTRSQGSNDSGKGSCALLMNEDNSEREVVAGSDMSPGSCNSLPPISPPILQGPDDEYIVYNFELPADCCGILIGRKGRFINPLKSQTGTQIALFEYSPASNICSISGPRANVLNALNQIRMRYADECFANITFNHVELTPTIPLTQACQLYLPPIVWTEVILSCTINAGHFFLQQPTHPTYPTLSHLDREMRQNYSKMDAPLVPQVHPGLICAFPTTEGWFRASVKNVHLNTNECDLVFVDYGGYVRNVPVSSLRQIHRNFMSLPFQASECYLARVQPVNCEVGWTPEANMYFEKLANGHIIYAQIDSIAEDGIPYVNLLTHNGQGESNISIQDELVKAGHACWI